MRRYTHCLYTDISVCSFPHLFIFSSSFHSVSPSHLHTIPLCSFCSFHFYQLLFVSFSCLAPFFTFHFQSFSFSSILISHSVSFPCIFFCRFAGSILSFRSLGGLFSLTLQVLLQVISSPISGAFYFTINRVFGNVRVSSASYGPGKTEHKREKSCFFKP